MGKRKETRIVWHLLWLGTVLGLCISPVGLKTLFEVGIWKKQNKSTPNSSLSVSDSITDQMKEDFSKP